MRWSYNCGEVLVHDLTFVGPLELQLVAPKPEEKNPTKYTTLIYSLPPDTPQGKMHCCIFLVSICSGLGATKFKFWTLRSQTKWHQSWRVLEVPQCLQCSYLRFSRYCFEVFNVFKVLILGFQGFQNPCLRFSMYSRFSKNAVG